MALLLNIDTATEHASVCLSEDENVIAMEKSYDQKSHASFIQPAIQKLFQKTGKLLSDINAVAGLNGPGSYTGLRVGLATAKGLCYALNKPLILLNTLDVMARASILKTTNDKRQATNILFCPMIDARRMEVFTALYDQELKSILAPSAVILHEETFDEYLENHTIIFSGSGSKKFKDILQNTNAVFSETEHSAADMIIESVKSFTQQNYADIAYSEPFYLKEFFTTSRNAIDKKF